jgi:hypothetical protein
MQICLIKYTPAVIDEVSVIMSRLIITEPSGTNLSYSHKKLVLASGSPS